MNRTPKQALAELIGTFTFVFIGAGAGSVPAESGGNLVGVALAHGFALVVIIYTWGSVSGAHVNPAVTLGVLAGGKIGFGKAIVYWIAQFFGAAAAAYLLLYLWGSGHGLGETTGSLTATDSMKTIVLEAVLTFFLVAAVFSSGVANNSGNLVGVAIGLVLTMDILFGGPLTGASMNPARSFGPAIAAGHTDYLWMYFVGPGIGGLAAGLLYGGLFLPAPASVTRK
jgi:MIP family channel proteins